VLRHPKIPVFPGCSLPKTTNLFLNVYSLSIATVGIIMTGLGTTMLSAFVGLGFIMGVHRLARRVSYKRYEQQRQQETRAYRMAAAAQDTGAGKKNP
jgi:hypothetical protein